MRKEIAELVGRAIGQGQSMGEEITSEWELDDGDEEELAAGRWCGFRLSPQWPSLSRLSW